MNERTPNDWIRLQPIFKATVPNYASN